MSFDEGLLQALLSLFPKSPYISFNKLTDVSIHNELIVMSTKTPASVAEFPQESLEKLAYSVVADIATREPNDKNRLGYHVWSWLLERKGTLEQAMKVSGARTQLPIAEVYKLVAKRLEEKGIKLS